MSPSQFLHKHNRSLRHALLWALAIGLVLPAVLFGGLTAVYKFNEARSQALAQILDQHAQILTMGMVEVLWNYNTEAGVPLIDASLRTPSVVRIELLDSTERIILSKEMAERRTGYAMTTRRDILRYGRKIGSVTIEVTSAPLEATAFRDIFVSIAITLLQLTLSLGLIFTLVNRRLVRPLQRLSDAAQRLAGRQLDAVIIPESNDEIGALAQRMDETRRSLQSLFAELDRKNAELTRELDALAKAEAEIRHLNDDLERRVLQRTQELVIANQELRLAFEKLSVAKDELVRSEKMAALGSLVAGVAHELNTPIGNALMVGSTLSHRTQEFSDSVKTGLKRSALEDFLNNNIQGSKMLVTNLTRAAELISSFKQIAVDQTTTQRRPFHLREICNEVNLTLTPTLKKLPYKVINDIPREIVMDSFPGPLGQVFINFINNSLTHAFEGRESGSMRFSIEDYSDGCLTLVFADDGAGIPANIVKRIFEPFFTTKLGHGGSGLGLHIVHNIVTNVLGGTIQVSSTVDQGTEFRVRMPCTAPQTQTATAA